MPLLEDVKQALRVTNPEFDSEVQDLIDAARSDLIRAGISAEKVNAEGKELDRLIKLAIKTYCKAHFGYDNPEADRFLQSYDLMKQELSLSSEYRAVSTNETQ